VRGSNVADFGAHPQTQRLKQTLEDHVASHSWSLGQLVLLARRPPTAKVRARWFQAQLGQTSTT
jgi:hypothetical protein